MTEINWPEIVAGFALGLLPLVVRQLYIFIKYTRQPGRRKYLGTLWGYHRSTTGSGHVFERRLTVKYSLFLDRLTVQTIDTAPDDAANALPGLSYSGHISPRQGSVRYIFLRDLASHEQITWYIIDPFFDPFRTTVGLYLALDLRGLPAAGPIVLSRERLAINEAQEYLENHVLRVEPVLPKDIYRQE